MPEGIRRWAQKGACEVKQQQEETLAAFDAREGERLTLTVVEGGELLWPQGFNPLNLQVLADGSLLHTRFL